MTGGIEESVDLRYGHFLRRLSCVADFHDVIAGSDLAFFDNTKIEPGPSAGRQQGGHARLIHSNADAVAGYARLRDFKECAADAETVADAHDIIGETFDREVFAVLPINEAGALQLFLPVTI